MSTLLSNKQWLTIGEAAKYLSDNVFSEQTSEADILQFALVERLTLSVNIHTPQDVLMWQRSEEIPEEIPEQTKIIGIYDLLLDIGDAPDELKNRLQLLHYGKVGKHDVSTISLIGEDGVVYELPDVADLEIVVRSTALTDFRDSIIQPIKPGVDVLRLLSLNKHMKALEKTAKNKKITFDKQRLLCSKKMMLGWLQSKSHKPNNLFKIKLATFDTFWRKTAKQYTLCPPASVDKDFFTKIQG